MAYGGKSENQMDDLGGLPHDLGNVSFEQWLLNPCCFMIVNGKTDIKNIYRRRNNMIFGFV